MFSRAVVGGDRPKRGSSLVFYWPAVFAHRRRALFARLLRRVGGRDSSDGQSSFVEVFVDLFFLCLDENTQVNGARIRVALMESRYVHVLRRMCTGGSVSSPLGFAPWAIPLSARRVCSSDKKKCS